MSSRPPSNPTLEVIRDGRTERVYDIKGNHLHIGRIPGMGVYLEDLRVSRRHALIERDPDGTCYVVDLRSKCSTQVDGSKLKPFQPVPLRDGSRIKIIGYDLVFHHTTVEGPYPKASESTVLQTLDDLSSEYLAGRSNQPSRALRAMLEINRSLSGRADLDEVLDRALDGLMAVFPGAERGFILTVELEGTPRVRAMRDRSGRADHRPLSRTIVRDVLEKGKAIEIADSAADPRFQLEDSVVSSVRTALCVPLLGHDGRPLGMIELDSQKLLSGFSPGDLDLLATLTVPISVAIENYRLLQEHASWAAAREIQLALLPQRRPQTPGYAFWECYQPSMAVGGDFYDYIEVEPARTGEKRGTRWAVSLGDVVGKGMPAALLAASVCPEVRYLASSGIRPEEILGRVNRRVFEAGVEAIFVTMILVEVDADSHSITVVNAGHAAPLLRRATGEVVPIAEQGARLPLGVDPQTVYQPVTIPLKPGDLVVLYTDGVTEGLDSNRRPYGEKRLQQTLAATGHHVTSAGEGLLASIVEHASGRSQFDDVTIVCFGRVRD
jgi:serine phosphatase RsbU (regulator of sigma subunit)/pSer/pThr/pTyr-binding forkhead associated (FHA) protein